MWALDLFISYTLGGLINILLAIAVVVIPLKLFSGRRA